MIGKKISTMEEFSVLIGISRPTLSKYFQNTNSVRMSTRKKIEEALEKYDYHPNIYAINQNRRLTKNIGIVVPYLSDPFFAEIARHIEKHCIERGYSPTLFSSHGNQELEMKILDTLRSVKPAGVLLAALGRSSDKKVIEKFCEDIPTVLFDSNIGDIGEVFVGSDNQQFTSLMVEYLCRTGLPPLFLEMKTPPNPNTRKRHAGYLKAMEKLNQTPEIYKVKGEGWALEEIGHRAGVEIIKSGLFKSKSILCSNDRLAIGFLSACYEANLKVGIDEGCDLRVAGLDGHPLSAFTSPSLTTVSHDYNEIAERSVETLFLMVEEKKKSDCLEMLFEGKLQMRSSA